MRKVKRVKIGDYVFISKYGDRSLFDPWYIGFICELGEDKRGNFYQVAPRDGSYPSRRVRHCWKITKEEGKALFELYKNGEK